MICPHCKQRKMHEETSVFTSSLNPAGDSLNKIKGMSCKNCGHWIDIVTVVKPKLPLKTDKIMPHKAFVIKYFDYINFLKEQGYVWREIGLMLKMSDLMLYKHYGKIKKERKLK